jgi:pilus assembly protein FimV
MVAKTLSRALALTLLSSPAVFGLGLGDIRLLSSLNAPLDAEIELVGATPEELTGLKTQIASRETFQRYGLDWPAFMANLAVQPVRTPDGRDVIRLRSTEAMTEPFVTVLVEVNWARGKLVREYTMLLDPPVYTPGQAVGANAPVAAPTAGDSARTGAISRAAEPAEQAVRPESPQDSPGAPRAAVPIESAAAGSSRVVRRGDTLSRIAGEVSGGDTRSSRRWMVAIYRSNPRAFDGNMNILRSGAELQIPDNSTVEGISTSEATAEIRQQHAAWRGTAAPTSEAAEEPGRLKLVPPAAAATAGAGASSAAPANPALQARVRELEAQLLESRRLIELRNAEVAQLQARLASQPGAQAPEAEPAPPVSAEPSPPPADTPETAEAPPEGAPAAAPAPPPAEPAAKAAEPDPVAEGSLLDKIKEFWWAGAALLVALLALFGLRAWRARQQSEFDDSLGRLAGGGADREFNAGDTAPIRAIEPEPGFLVEETGTHERPRFTGGPGEAPIAPPNVATEDTISSETAINLDQGDPLAEADFHMAYGLYDQAADLVRIAIAREPERRDLKLKLLEVFFVWGNKEQFLGTARELADTRDQAAPGEWEKIVIMGKQLAPEDELFGSGVGHGAAAAGGVDLDLEGGQSRVDFDLLGEPVPGAEGVDLDIGSALGDKDATAESPTRTTDAHLALHESDVDDPSSATTREMTQRVSPEPAPLLPDYDFDGSEEAPTVEQPAMYGEDHPTIRQKVDVALRQDRGDQTAELAIDDLGLDLTALDTVDQPGLGSSPDAPTLVAGLDEQSRRVMADAEQRGAQADEEATGSSATGAWRVRPEDLDPTMPPTKVQAFEGDISATSRMSAISEEDIDFDFDAVGGEENSEGNGGVDLDVGTATVPDAPYTATQRISSEDLALPDLEPATMSEVGTKLDLARAYMDMGDPEGARNILEEVLQEGSVNQKQEAQRLIASLPG